MHLRSEDERGEPAEQGYGGVSLGACVRSWSAFNCLGVKCARMLPMPLPGDLTDKEGIK